MKKKIVSKIKKLFASGFLYVFMGNLINKGIAFISSAITARLITKADYAYFSYADNIYNYVNLLAGAGIALSLVKFCSTTKDKGKDRAYLNFSQKHSLWINIVITVIVVSAFWCIGIPYPEAKSYLLLMLLYPVFSYAVQILQSYLRAKQDVKHYAYGNLLQTITICIFSVALILIIGGKGVVVARYIGVIIACLYALAYVRKDLWGVTQTSLTKDEKNAFVKMSIALMIANFFSSVMPINENYLINNLIVDTTVVSNFKVAGMLPSHLSIVTSSVCIFYFPIIAKMEDTKAAYKKIVQAQMVNFTIVLCVVAVGMLSSRWFISTVYGMKYSDAVSLSYVLWIMRAINALFRMLPMNLIPALGKTRFNSMLAIISCLVHVGSDYCLIKAFGVNGVAFASIIIYSVTAVLYWVYLYRVCHKTIKKKEVNEND